MVADVQDQVGQAAAERLTEKGARRAEYRRLDITDGASVAAVADAIVRAHGRVDVLVNNAGIAESSPTFELDEAT